MYCGILMKQLLYKFVAFSLLFQTLLHAAATTGLNCDGNNISRESQKLCVRNKVLEKYNRIESLKKEILSKLGLNEAPNITAPNTLPASMIKDFSSLQRASTAPRTAPYYAMPITTHSVSQTRHKFGISQQNTREQSTIYAYSYLFFNFTIEPKHQNVYRAKLIFKLGKELSLTPKSPRNVHTLVLYAEQGGKEVVLVKQPIRAISDTYKLDITKYIQNLVKKSKHTKDVPSLGFSLRMAVFKNNKKITRLVDETRDPPRILIQSYDERDAESRRSRRAASLRYCTGRNEENCCVRPLEINFSKDLGWDYIASPPSFNANYCDGSCPLNWHTENNLFYDILYKYATKNNRHIGPCCVPNEYESLNIIYFNGNNEPIVAKLPNVIVRSCSCR